MSGQAPDGGILVDLEVGAAGVEAVSVRSARTLGVGALLVGRIPAEALALLPRVYSVCADAQASAAVGAVEAAGGVQPVTGRHRGDQLAARTVHAAVELVPPHRVAGRLAPTAEHATPVADDVGVTVEA